MHIYQIIGKIISGDFNFNDSGSAGGYKPPRILSQHKDAKGRPVIEVEAENSRDAIRCIEGWTYPGDVSWVATNNGNNRWTIHLEDWDK